MVVIDLRAISIGLGTILPVCTVAIQNAVEVHHLGTATSIVNFFFSPARRRHFGRHFWRDQHRAQWPFARDRDATAFGLVFRAAAVQLGLALVCMSVLEEGRCGVQ